MARATVIIPTFGYAKFARWAIKSVQQQTVKDIEICIVCDGSPEEMVTFFNEIAVNDQRIRVFCYPKSPRTGEPYRDEVIKQMTGKIICYCSHDDLWLPNHIKEVEKTLKECDFTHSIHAAVNTPDNINDSSDLFSIIYWIDLEDTRIINQMHNNVNFFGLTFGAHTKDSYLKLEEGWVTTPQIDIPTDLFMWNKFLSAKGISHKTTMRITALNFPLISRKEWSEQDRDDELKLYFVKIQDTVFLNNIEEHFFRQYQREILYFKNTIRDKQNHVLSIENIMNEKDRCIFDLENIMNEKDRCIFDLENMVRDKDRYILELENMTCEKDRHIFDLENIMREKDRYILELENMTREKDKAILGLESMNKEKDKIIHQLKTSSLYRVIGRWVKYKILRMV